MTQLQQSEAVRTGYRLPLMEDFYTLQGEGHYQGHAAYFIRLGGCDVGCHWCDVKESWDASRWPDQAVEEIVSRASAYPARLAVVTGGEPLMYDLAPLTAALKAAGFRTHIETSGAHPLSGDWDWITFSPKKFKAPLPGIGAVAQELKVIVYNKSDFKWAESFEAQVGQDCVCLLQPEWDKTTDVMPLIIDYVKSNPRWQVSLQTHKFMDIP